MGAKRKNINFKIQWEIMKKTKNIRNGDKMCRLCIEEIRSIFKNNDAPLNSRNELMNKCRHSKQYLLKNWKKKQKTRDNQ